MRILLLRSRHNHIFMFSRRQFMFRAPTSLSLRDELSWNTLKNGFPFSYECSFPSSPALPRRTFVVRPRKQAPCRARVSHVVLTSGVLPLAAACRCSPWAPAHPPLVLYAPTQLRSWPAALAACANLPCELHAPSARVWPDFHACGSFNPSSKALLSRHPAVGPGSFTPGSGGWSCMRQAGPEGRRLGRPRASPISQAATWPAWLDHMPPIPWDQLETVIGAGLSLNWK